MFSWLPKGNADQASLVDEDNLVSADNDELRAETHFVSVGGDVGKTMVLRACQIVLRSAIKFYQKVCKSCISMPGGLVAWSRVSNNTTFSHQYNLYFEQEKKCLLESELQPCLSSAH